MTTSTTRCATSHAHGTGAPLRGGWGAIAVCWWHRELYSAGEGWASHQINRQERMRGESGRRAAADVQRGSTCSHEARSNFAALADTRALTSR